MSTAFSTNSLGQETPHFMVEAAMYATVGILGTIQQAVRKHGPIVRLLFEDGAQKLVVGTPEAFELWRRNSTWFIKDVDEFPATAALTRLVLDNNLTTAREGEEWDAMRSLVAPLMRYKMQPYSDAVKTASARMIENLVNPHSHESLLSTCETWSAGTVCHPVIGYDFEPSVVTDTVEAVRRCMFHLVRRAADSSMAELRADEHLRDLRSELDRLVIQAIATSRPEDDTMVSVLLAKHGLLTTNSPDRQVVDMMRPILIGALAAAVHNNSLALFWTLTQLAQASHICDEIAEEAALSLEGGSGWHPSMSPVATAAVREALRIYPVLPLIERTAVTNLTIEGHNVIENDTILFAPWIVHRNPEIWPDPLVFDIKRFLNRERIDHLHWLPFGLGHRACIGSNLALHQLVWASSIICRDLRLAMPPATKPSYWQPTYRVLLEPRENGGRLVSTHRLPAHSDQTRPHSASSG